MMELHEGLKNNVTDFVYCGRSNYFDGLVLDGFRLPNLNLLYTPNIT